MQKTPQTEFTFLEQLIKTCEALIVKARGEAYHNMDHMSNKDIL